MAGFVESRNGRYRARFTPPGGKEISETFDRKVDANEWLDRQRGDAARGQWIDPRGGKTLFGDYAVNWLKGRVHLVESTAAKEDRDLRNHLLPTFGNLQLRAIGRQTVQNWVTSLVTKGLAPSTVRVTYQLLVKIMHSAVADKLIHESPCTAVNLPATTGKLTIPGLEQLELVAGRLPAGYRRVVPTVAGCGLREGELFGLTVDRVDFLRRTVTVDRQLQPRPKLRAELDRLGRLPKGSGAVHVSGDLFLVAPKSARSERVVPVGRHTLGVLAAQIEEFPPGALGLLFRTGRGGALTSQTFTDAWERATRVRLGSDPQRPDPTEDGGARDPALAPYFTFHDVRHFYASLLIAKGVPVTRVAACMGHTETECLRTYSHLWPGDDDRVRAATDGVLGATAEPPASEQLAGERH